MRTLVFTTVFPNPAQPLHGLFVAERTRYAARLAATQVIAPVPWFYRARVDRQHTSSEGIRHPRFFYLPGLLKCLDGLLLFLSALPTVRRVRQQFDFDLIDAHFGYPDGVAAVLLGWWFGRPVTVTLRGSELHMASYRLRRTLMGWALRRANRIIAVSGQLADLAVELGVPRSHVRVIGNGVDLVRFRPLDRSTARQTLGIPGAAPLIVMVGHLARVKRFDLVLRTLPDLAREHDQLRCAIVGGTAASSGSYPTELRDEIVRLALMDRVTITGSVSPEEVAVWLSAADLFVLASDREGSPNALREALACGCPVVTSDVGDVRHIMPACAGLIVDEDASETEWRTAIASALARRWNREEIRSVAEQHSWENVAAQVVAEWRACCGTDVGLTARASVR